MLRTLTRSLTVVLMAVLAAAPATMAEDKVTGQFALDFNGCWPGAASDEVPIWVGTIDLGGDVHDMVFFNLGDGRPPFSQDPPEGSGTFIEIWAVYDGLGLAFDGECALESFEGDLVMWGHDAGLSRFDAQEYAMTGTVVEAFGDYADLAGAGVAMSGTFTVDDDGNPLTAPGVIEIG
jgi:hypothetical protein